MTGIEWTDTTDNIIKVKGEDGKPDGNYCIKKGPACANCYAEALNQNSFFGGNKMPYRVRSEGPPPLMLRYDIMKKWAKQRKPKRHFVCSMTDICAEFVPYNWFRDILDYMVLAPKQTFQILTKRAERMANMVDMWLFERGMSRVPNHIWLGVSAGTQTYFDKRIPHLVRLPAIRFLSLEPLLAPIDMGDNKVDWVIVGGESGQKARPMDTEWAVSLKDQCIKMGIPFFFKQYGKYIEHEDALRYGIVTDNYSGYLHNPYDDTKYVPITKKQDPRLLDGKLWEQFPDIS